jgi:hypothetical protein
LSPALRSVTTWIARYQSHLRRMALFAVLLGLAVLALAFAHAWDSALPSSAARAKCFETFSTAQWPKWIGCAMAAHESLAPGLIGLWAAIFAAWLAYSGIQKQIDEDRQKTAIRQIAAKEMAVVAISQAIHAAASTLFAVTKAQKAKDQQQIAHWHSLIDRGVLFIEECLNHFSVREAVSRFGHRRLGYLLGDRWKVEFLRYNQQAPCGAFESGYTAASPT